MQEKVQLKEIETLRSPTYGMLTLPKIIKKITSFAHSFPDHQYRIIIGTDSQERNHKAGRGIELVTALIVHRVGGGGIYFWKGTAKKLPHTLKEKIYEEALASLEFANEFLYLLKEEPELLKFDLEIHVDIGEKGKTREIIAEVVAMIKGSGYEVKTKPEAFGASKVADRHT